MTRARRVGGADRINPQLLAKFASKIRVSTHGVEASESGRWPSAILPGGWTRRRRQSCTGGDNGAGDHRFDPHHCGRAGHPDHGEEFRRKQQVRAVVLVGGEGTRLRPLTLTAPKQMLPIVEQPMIERVLGHLAEHGIDDAILSLGYRPDAFINAYPAGNDRPARTVLFGVAMLDP